jgi:hypothetical protein
MKAYVTHETVEAQAILGLVERGILSLDDARQLINIETHEASVLKAFAASGGRAGVSVGMAVRFRERVLAEFERLVTESWLTAYSDKTPA